MAHNEIVTYINGGRRRHRVEVYALGANDTILISMNGYGSGPELPGGGIDKGESVIQAAMRELAEESGWIAKDPCAIDLAGDWIFRGIDDGWFNREGWTEEENLAVTCTAIGFAPTELYGAEGDGLEFNLVPIVSVIEKLESMEPSSPRSAMKTKFKLAILSQLLRLSNEKPEWRSW